MYRSIDAGIQQEAEAELRGIGGQLAELEVKLVWGRWISLCEMDEFVSTFWHVIQNFFQVAKRQAVQVEDYDRAKTLKKEIEVLR